MGLNGINFRFLNYIQIKLKNFKRAKKRLNSFKRLQNTRVKTGLYRGLTRSKRHEKRRFFSHFFRVARKQY